MIYELHKDRLNLLNFAVDPDMRGSSIGRQMIEKLQGKISDPKSQRRWINTTVRETNVDALRFFGRVGFKTLRMIDAPFDDSAEDGVLLVCSKAAARANLERG